MTFAETEVVSANAMFESSTGLHFRDSFQYYRWQAPVPAYFSCFIM